MGFEIASLTVGGGRIGICPAPGRFGDYESDFRKIALWSPALVMSMTEEPELCGIGAGAFGADLAETGIARMVLPVRDYGIPEGETARAWPEKSHGIRGLLARGERVLVHCLGGCGRSGMAVTRLLVEMGEAPEAALARLRAVRPCAVETEAQVVWAANHG